MLALVLSILAQGGSPLNLPPRDYQPSLIDPGLDGGINRGFQTNGDLTPDGRLFIGFRDASPSASGWPYRSALVAAVVRPDRVQANANGNLSAFFDLATPTTSVPFGSGFVFGALDSALGEQKVIHYGWEADPCTTGCLNLCGTSTPSSLSADTYFPFSDEYGQAHFNICLRPRTGGNPYRSNAIGSPQNAGRYTTYELWLVRIHAFGFGGHLCATGQPAVGGGDPIRPDPSDINRDWRLVCQNIKVVIDADAAQVVHTVVEPVGSLGFEALTDTNGAVIKGIEPTITADGKLIVYHGNGSAGSFAPGNANVTYVYNPTPCMPTGWTTPRSITELPTFTGTSEQIEAQRAAFKRTYKIFAQPIRLAPSSADPDGYEYKDGWPVGEVADTVRGTYPWVSKDGSFFMAKCTTADEAVEPGGPGPRTRCGTYVCGDLTGGYLKLIDDAALNPTRRGGPFDWPAHEDSADPQPNSWRTFSFTTGIRPGMWEPLIGENLPIPVMDASAAIPVLPVFESEIDSYGEVRFEEVDGNYRLYLACNESYQLDGSALPGEADLLFDLPSMGDPNSSTPDTSGRPARALCVMNAGAGFPQEVLDDSALLRQAIGQRLGPILNLHTGARLHENVGFKGQAIVFNADGNILCTSASPADFGLDGLQRFTVQAFVKVVGTPTSTHTLFEYGGLQGSTYEPIVTLKLDPQGRFTARVVTTTGSVQVVSHNQAVPFGGDLFDPLSGWRHVAFTFNGSTNGKTNIKIYLDSALDFASTMLTTSTVKTPVGAPYYLIGPGRTATPAAIDDEDALFVLDEVAVSPLLRGAAELRRDAFVAQPDDGLDGWPDEAPDLPLSLNAEEARWPDGVGYDPDIVALGRDLFDDEILSANDARKCSTCHIPAEHFADEGQQFAQHINGTDNLPLNTPTLLNAVFGTHKEFAGGAATIEDQVWHPILSGTEMGVQTVQEVLGRLNDPNRDEVPLFATRFTDTFGEPADQENVAAALAMYLRTLNSGGSAYDNQLFAESHDGLFMGNLPIMNAAQRRGRALFFGKARCFGCHRGTSFTDDAFHNVLTVKTIENNLFRGAVTGRAADNGRVKTPTLRDVQHTGPYFHDGSKASLLDVVQHYNEPPFGATDRVGTADVDLRPLGLLPDEMDDLVAFLHSLSGTIP